VEAHEETEARGVAWTFQWNGSGWSGAQQLEAVNGGEDVYFGEYVGLSADGSTAIVAEPGWGGARVFRHEPDGWSERGPGLFGEAAVALSGDGSLALSGEARGAGRVNPYELLFGPFLETGTSATEVTDSAAAVHAEVDPEGHEVTECKVEYGIKAFTTSAPCQTLPGAGNAFVEVTAHLAGLEPHTTYIYRFRASSSAGYETLPEPSFTTLGPAPAVSTGAASAIGETSAAIAGTVDPNGLTVTVCRFEYGTTEAYGSTVACSSEPGSGESPQQVSAALTGLTPGQTYHYRLLARNSSGTTYGLDAQFEAAPALLPEFGVCSSAAGRTGGFSDKGCVKPVAGDGKYAWQPWPAGPGGAGGTVTGPVTIETASRDRLRCSAGTLAGRLSGPQSAEQTLTLTGCDATGLAGAECSSAATAGEVRFEPLLGKLGIISAGAKPDVGWRLAALHGGPLASFTCGSTHYTLGGAVIAPLKSIDKASGSFSLTFKGKRGVQTPGSFEGQGSSALTLSGPHGAEAASLSSHMTFGEGGGVEVKAIA
jgi:hypothetical protein